MKAAIEARSKKALGHNSTPVVAHTQTVVDWHRRGRVTTTGDFKMIRDWYTHHAHKMRGRGIEDGLDGCGRPQL